MDYLDLVQVLKDKEGLVLFLEERNGLPEEFKVSRIIPKAFTGTSAGFPDTGSKSETEY